MCRLFGFRSVIQSQVHRSLVSADNALAVQSAQHPHGWGVAFYQSDVPHLIKGTSSAMEDQIFHRVSGVVASETVLAHIRKATVGELNILNSHPFQFGHWVMAHNGNVPNFETVRGPLRALIAPNLRRFILGDTDSEVIFYLFLSNLARHEDLTRRGADFSAVVASLKQTIEQVREIADREGAEENSLLTIIVTDGKCLAATRQGTSLHFSTYKMRCLDREHCPFLAPECEAETQTGFVNHLLVSSEPLQGDNVWIEMDDDDLVGVDWRMRLHRERL